jgi:hypothetical protein
MVGIQFDNYLFKIKTEAGKELIFDANRKQWIVLTPEEWVRQNFLQWMMQEMKYPAALINVEKEILLGDQKKRFDIAVYSSAGTPWMIVECKAMDVPINEKVMHQILNYNQVLQVPYVTITNGSFTRCFQLLPTYLELSSLPAFGS